MRERYWALYESRKADVNRSADRHTTNLLDVEPAIHVPSRRQNAAIRTPQAVSQAQSRLPATYPAAQNFGDAISASSSTFSALNTHKAKGTDVFKLGQYVDAKKAYASAFDTLPVDHLHHGALHNNRAVT